MTWQETADIKEGKALLLLQIMTKRAWFTRSVWTGHSVFLFS
ncbi:hypothetical protein [Rossellomorea marisflavi]